MNSNSIIKQLTKDIFECVRCHNLFDAKQAMYESLTTKNCVCIDCLTSELKRRGVYGKEI